MAVELLYPLVRTRRGADAGRRGGDRISQSPGFLILGAVNLGA